MSANANEPPEPAASHAAKHAAPAETAPPWRPGDPPKKLAAGRTVCNEKNEKGKLCNGHLKQLRTGGLPAEEHLRGDDVLYKCQVCGALYVGPPLGHVRDPEKQSRFVQKELTEILQAAGGTLPFFPKKTETTPAEQKIEAPAAATAATAAPAGETAEEKRARLIAEAKEKAAAAKAAKLKEGGPAASATRPAAPVTSGTDSSPQADAHRPAAEAQAATGQASAVPLSPAAATASPVAGAETPEELAPDPAPSREETTS